MTHKGQGQIISVFYKPMYNVPSQSWIDVDLIQEPYQYRGEVQGLGISTHVAYRVPPGYQVGACEAVKQMLGLIYYSLDTCQMNTIAFYTLKGKVWIRTSCHCIASIHSQLKNARLILATHYTSYKEKSSLLVWMPGQCHQYEGTMQLKTMGDWRHTSSLQTRAHYSIHKWHQWNKHRPNFGHSQSCTSLDNHWLDNQLPMKYI